MEYRYFFLIIQVSVLYLSIYLSDDFHSPCFNFYLFTHFVPVRDTLPIQNVVFDILALTINYFSAAFTNSSDKSYYSINLY